MNKDNNKDKEAPESEQACFPTEIAEVDGFIAGILERYGESTGDSLFVGDSLFRNAAAGLLGAVMTGLSCLGSFGFSGYIAQEALADGAQIGGGTVALGLAALAATAAIAVGGVYACVKGVRAVGRRLCAGKAIRAR